HAAQAIVTDNVCLRRKSFCHVGDVSQINGGVTDLLDRQIVQFLHCSRRSVDADVILELADLSGAGRQYQVLQVHRADQVSGRKSFRLEQGGIQVDHPLRLLSTVRIWNGCARNRDELGSQEIQADVVQLLFGEPITGKRELENRHRGSAEIDDQWGLGAGGELAQKGLRYGCFLGIGGIKARILVEEECGDTVNIYRRLFYSVR